ncbi:hypothetical protein GTY65_01255 [Streptomyces sp. SID8379]|uniref:hypothetical protein n=1 Tax=unclassified Streptomyces TaxID=2593676 RepID=UPI0003709483|nr:MULTISPECIES: hypothetical protein [unclassified Streptomyces]MYW62714.1 hypothetical protein [Streptomyces sp. SID8379]
MYERQAMHRGRGPPRPCPGAARNSQDAQAIHAVHAGSAPPLVDDGTTNRNPYK